MLHVLNLRPAAVLALLLALLPATPAAAQDVLVFAAAPTLPEARTLEVYQPFVEYLSEKLGRPVELHTAENFLQYANEMRAGHYDIVFDGPHFIGYRMERLGHIPVVRLTGDLNYVVVTKEGSSLRGLDGLEARRVCGLPSPNFVTFAFLDHFPNPVRQPLMQPVRNFKESVECARSGKAEAALVQARFWGKADKSQLRVLYKNDVAFPERGFSAGPAVDAKTRSALAKAILESKDAAAGQTLLEVMGGKGFVAADPAEYKGLGRLLKAVWGYY